MELLPDRYILLVSVHSGRPAYLRVERALPFISSLWPTTFTYKLLSKPALLLQCNLKPVIKGHNHKLGALGVYFRLEQLSAFLQAKNAAGLGVGNIHGLFFPWSLFLEGDPILGQPLTSLIYFGLERAFAEIFVDFSSRRLLLLLPLHIGLPQELHNLFANLVYLWLKGQLFLLPLVQFHLLPGPLFLQHPVFHHAPHVDIIMFHTTLLLGRGLGTTFLLFSALL